MSEVRKELKVSAIENGTVIDHIPAKSLFQVVKILKLSTIPNQLLFGTNLSSKKYGNKGIIKVNDKYFEAQELNKIALVAPTATLIVIKDFTVVYKKQVELPKEIKQFVRCVNPNCITNHESIDTQFEVHTDDEGQTKLLCNYCEKFTAKDHMVFI
ncbi:MAG: aspartate carbamoyltransferase regulatory subunit [Bacteroidetes bacterium]|nr:aspartate carbamoyltransferase regulatory subunit [Bacteroidota bacterium]